MLMMLYSYLFVAFSLISIVASSLLLETKSISVELMSLEMPLSNPFSINLDFMSLTFFFVVCTISSMVFIYSKFYMDEKWEKNMKNTYFFTLMMFFVLSMMVLIFSNSWMTLMVGWDGLGITSFLLVIFYNNKSSLDSGMLTVLTNRVGDCLFILTFMVMYHSGWFNWNFIKFSENFNIFSAILMTGAITKSAQFPFSSWLPAAMAAPTPVSSLVHSSTLVTAGIFVMLRFNYLLSSCFNPLAFLSLMTMVLGGLCAMKELDFKKVVAMSTLSQLGFMIFSITMGYWMISFFHMVFHAFFKSCLFLATGNLMHLLSSDQESRSFGGMGSSLMSSMYFTLSVVSLMGFPFSLGFYSKDTILGTTMGGMNSINSFLFTLGCCLTVAYSSRLISLSFFNTTNSSTTTMLKEMNYYALPLMPIYLGCVISGNFFFYNFFPPLSMSLTEASIGVLIILSGVALSSMKPSAKKFAWNFLSSMTNLTQLMFLTSMTMKDSPSKMDPSWMEISTSEGLKSMMILLPKTTNFTFKTNIWVPMTTLTILMVLNMK